MGEATRWCEKKEANQQRPVQSCKQQDNRRAPKPPWSCRLPLLVREKNKIKVPPALRESEARLVRDLKDFWEQEKGGMMAGKEVYVLRNLSRGKGVGFFENSGFYPDFILWVVDSQRKAQRIIFVEPHGMLQAKAYIHDEKARLHERLPQLAQEVAQRRGREGISLESFITTSCSRSAIRTTTTLKTCFSVAAKCEPR